MSLELLTEIGGVRVEYSGDREDLPSRVRNTLKLPKRDGMEIHLLKGGVQFLVMYPGTKTRWGSRCDGRTFFGGMDESPFITSLEDVPVAAFRAQGEDAFFEALIPHQIKTLQRRFPDASVSRQGDVWSFKLPYSWDELRAQVIPKPKYLPVGGRGRFYRAKMERENHRMRVGYRMQIGQFNYLKSSPPHARVLGTNHSIKGPGGYVSLQTIENGLGPFHMFVAEGMLTAPDHAPQVLQGGPHLMVRTPHLTDPRDLAIAGGD